MVATAGFAISKASTEPLPPWAAVETAGSVVPPEPTASVMTMAAPLLILNGRLRALACSAPQPAPTKRKSCATRSPQCIFTRYSTAQHQHSGRRCDAAHHPTNNVIETNLRISPEFHETPERDGGEGKRDQDVVSGEREAEEAPCRLVAAHNADVLQLIHEAARPERIERPGAILWARPPLPFDAGVV